MKHILVAVDGSGHSYKAVDFAADLAEKYEARLTAVHVVSDRPLTEAEREFAENEHLEDIIRDLDLSDIVRSRSDPSVFARELLSKYADTGMRLRRALGRQYLKKAENRAHAKGVRNTETVIEEGEPARAILRKAGECRADLIVTGSRGLGDIKGALLGSVSHKVAQQAEVTCLTVK